MDNSSFAEFYEQLLKILHKKWVECQPMSINSSLFEIVHGLQEKF